MTEQPNSKLWAIKFYGISESIQDYFIIFWRNWPAHGDIYGYIKRFIFRDNSKLVVARGIAGITANFFIDLNFLLKVSKETLTDWVRAISLSVRDLSILSIHSRYCCFFLAKYSVGPLLEPSGTFCVEIVRDFWSSMLIPNHSQYFPALACPLIDVYL